MNLVDIAHRRALVERYLSVDMLRAALRAARAAGDRPASQRIVRELQRRRVRS